MKGATLFKRKYLVKDPQSGWVRLGRPMILNFDKNLIQKLYEVYSDNEEIGGLLICLPKFSKKGKELQVIDIIPIDNLSGDTRIYQMDVSEAQRIINKYETKKKLIVPLTFHTHPVDKSELLMEPDEMNFFPYYEQLLPSDQDKAHVHFFNLTLYGHKYSPPDIVVVRNQILNKLFLGFYDIRDKTGIEEKMIIMKEEGMKIILEVAMEIVKKFVEKFDSPRKKLFMGALIGIGIGIFIFLYIKIPSFRKFVNIVATILFQMGAMELLFNLLEVEISNFYELHPYFKQTQLGGEAKLMIPKSLKADSHENIIK